MMFLALILAFPAVGTILAAAVIMQSMLGLNFVGGVRFAAVLVVLFILPLIAFRLPEFLFWLLVFMTLLAAIILSFSWWMERRPSVPQHSYL